MKPKIKWAGARVTRRRPRKVGLVGGRPRRQRLSEAEINILVRPWVPSALQGDSLHLAVLRSRANDFAIAEEAYKFLVERDGRRVSRDDRIETIADWLKMDAGRLKNWLNRAKRAR